MSIYGLSFNSEITLSDITALLTFVTIVIGGCFALKKWIVSMKLKRAEYIQNLTEKIRLDENIVFYLFEYDEPWYDIKFHESDLEKKVDYTLSYFSYFCYLRNNNIVSKRDFDCFKYQLERIIHNRQFIDYCYNLYHFSSRRNIPISFPDLFKYAKEKGCFDKDFWNKESYKITNKYHHYLNF